MMAVDINTQPGFSAGKPRQLFRGDYVRSYAGGPFYDVSSEGQRFLMLKPAGLGQDADQRCAELDGGVEVPRPARGMIST
jgi:hypothetical protein